MKPCRGVKLQLASVRDICVMTRNRRPNYAKRLWTRRLFNYGVQHGNNLYREQRIEDGSEFKNFVRMTKTDFEIPLQKIGASVQRKGTKLCEAIPASITSDIKR
jgi:hypothetical protein